jgi:ubiquinone/menaquinone biosynthesis C-methylase UbiE
LNPLERLKEASKWMWAQGDYAAVARLLEPGAITLADACSIAPGVRVLDVAAGNGNFALAAVRRGAQVTACDMTPLMVDLGRARTEAAGYEVEWLLGDAEQLPFAGGGYDVVATVFGAMFAPQPDVVAGELFRVCRRGGLVAMANYSRDGFLGSMSDLFARYSTPLPFELPSPFEWGEPDVVRRRFAPYAGDVEVQPDMLTWTFRSVDEGLDFWERTNAPTIALKMTVPPERYAEFRRDARELMDRLNTSAGDGLELKSSYLRVLARR